jgi:GTP pyrophosphokinase
VKTSHRERPESAAPIVTVADAAAEEAARADERTPHAAAESPLDMLQRARDFAEPLLAGQQLDTGEPALAHAEGVAAILQSIGAAPSMRAAAWLVDASDHLAQPEARIAEAFGAGQASLVAHTRKLVQIQRATRDAPTAPQRRAEQTERVRKMLLAFARDLRVVLLRLASRLQTLRWYAASKRECPESLAREARQVFAPLANRLGIWQIKWELEDLAFRFLEPAHYREVARLLDAKRVERERRVEATRARLEAELRAQGLHAEVQGRPKHLYSIWKKMQGKQLDFSRILDVRALRVIVRDERECYAALARVHELYRAVPGELDDYIARPKPNGYQSLHTVVEDEHGLALEVQIRTRAMHEHAELGVAAHWAYKEAGTKGYGGASSAAGEFEAQVAEARKAVLRQLLAWEREYVAEDARAAGVAATDHTLFDDRIYVFTPDAAIVELPARATPVDFAYALHTQLGHRCRGARVDGQMVPLNTPLASGQTVEIVAPKEGGPSLDWLNAELGYLQAPRSKAKVRAWFNAQVQAQTIARGREMVEKLLQREGRTAQKLDELATRLGFAKADALFEEVGKDEYSLRRIEALLRPAEPAPTPDEVIALRHGRQEGSRPEGETPKGGVLVVGVESLLTTLARCCRPAPPDAIGGYVTRGKGVAIHRIDCVNFRQMVERAPERRIAVAWGAPRGDRPALYPVDVAVEASDRQALLRDISEVFAKEKMNVTGVKTQSMRDASGSPAAWMTFTVEVADSVRLAQVLGLVARVAGVRSARRR